MPFISGIEIPIPFFPPDNDGKVNGYSWELCQRVVDAVKTRLNLPALEVVPVFTTSSTRILMAQTGVIDSIVAR